MSRRRRRNRRGPRSSSVRVTRTTGSGSSQTTSHHSGGISITGVAPTGRVAASPRLTVRATVRDQGGNLSKRDVKLYLDGSEKTRFHYDQASGQVSYFVGRALSPGTHEVRIEAEAPSSGDKVRIGGTASRRWTFTLARR